MSDLGHFSQNDEERFAAIFMAAIEGSLPLSPTAIVSLFLKQEISKLIRSGEEELAFELSQIRIGIGLKMTEGHTLNDSCLKFS